jgi:DNA recombination protein RmuC
VTNFFLEYGSFIIVAAAGMAVGALIAGLLVRSHLKSALGSKLQLAETQAALTGQKLASSQSTLQELQSRLAQTDQDLRACRTQTFDLHDDLRRESAALAQAREKGLHIEKLETELARKDRLLQDLRDRMAGFMTESAHLKTALAEEQKQAAEKIALVQEARDSLKSEFQNLAHRIFEEKSRAFGDQNRDSLNQLIGPLREQLGDFKKRVEDVYDKESRDRAALFTQIDHLKDLNQRISKEALNLTRALKGDSKARGNWGEMILERVLESSGLQKGREYELQVCLYDHDGRRFQPDAVIRLPEGKDVIVDAKVSLKAYEASYSAQEPDEKERALKAHLDSLRTHLRGLAAKSYETLQGVRTLDFVLMFIPVEAAFLAAVEKDSALFSEAFEKNIMVVSPSTLLVTLRTIQNIWRYENQNRNALTIAAKAGGLYDKFVGFVQALEEIGVQLEKARNAYRLAYERLVSGRGNLIRRTQELKALGVKAGKQMPPAFLDPAEDPGDPPMEN